MHAPITHRHTAIKIFVFLAILTPIEIKSIFSSKGAVVQTALYWLFNQCYNQPCNACRCSDQRKQLPEPVFGKLAGLLFLLIHS